MHVLTLHFDDRKSEDREACYLDLNWMEICNITLASCWHLCAYLLLSAALVLELGGGCVKCILQLLPFITYGWIVWMGNN